MLCLSFFLLLQAKSKNHRAFRVKLNKNIQHLYVYCYQKSEFLHILKGLCSEIKILNQKLYETYYLKLFMSHFRMINTILSTQLAQFSSIVAIIRDVT